MNIKEIKEKYKDLGMLNVWNETPNMILNCKKKGHKLFTKNTPRGQDNISWCPECKFYYHFDSSD